MAAWGYEFYLLVLKVSLSGFHPQGDKKYVENFFLKKNPTLSVVFRTKLWEKKFQKIVCIRLTCWCPSSKHEHGGHETDTSGI